MTLEYSVDIKKKMTGRGIELQTCNSGGLKNVNELGN